MKRIFGLLLLLGETVSGQYHLTLHITNEDSHQPIAGASVIIKGLDKGGLSDSTGFVLISDIGRGSFELQITCLGYKGREIKLDFPLKGTDEGWLSHVQRLQQGVERHADPAAGSLPGRSKRRQPLEIMP